MSEQSGGEFFLGFVIGALAGAAAALLMAPTSGDEMRHRIGEQSVALKGQAEKLAGEARSQAQHLAEEARGQAQQLAAEARSQAEHAQERGRIVLSENVKKAQQTVQEVQTKLNSAGETA